MPQFKKLQTKLSNFWIFQCRHLFFPLVLKNKINYILRMTLLEFTNSSFGDFESIMKTTFESIINRKSLPLPGNELNCRFLKEALDFICNLNYHLLLTQHLLLHVYVNWWTTIRRVYIEIGCYLKVRYLGAIKSKLLQKSLSEYGKGESSNSAGEFYEGR